MIGELSAALQRAMIYDTPDQRIDSLKQSVVNLLEASDPTAQIHKTEYFNHSFAPDLILRWPSDKRERLIFLRTNPNPKWLADDLRVIASSHPIMLTLDATGHPERSSDEAHLREMATDASALITDPGAIEEFTARRAPITSALTNAVMRGGIGVVNEIAARTAVNSALSGLDSATALEAEPTRAALQQTERILNDEQAGRITRLYQAVWEGHGGATENFPSTRNLSGPMTSGDLALLLTTLETDDGQFWRRVGRNITLEVLIDVGTHSGSINFDRLVQANLDRLAARGVRVFGDSNTDRNGVATWIVEKGCLVLRSPSWLAYFAPRSANLPLAEPRQGVTISSLLAGIRDLNVRMTEVKLQQSDFAISIEAVGEANVVDSRDFEQLATRGDSVARGAAISLSSGRSLIADFMSGTATGHTNAIFNLGELGPVAIKLLLELGGRADDDLEVKLRPVSDPVAVQDPLWD